MRNSIIIVVLLLSNSFVQAQRSKIPAYYFTKTSEYYLTDAEVDSLYFDEANDLLKERSIPESMIKATFPAIKKMLQNASQQKITEAFK